MAEVGVTVVKSTNLVNEVGLKYLNFNVTEEEIDRKPDIVRLFDGVSGKYLEYSLIEDKEK